MMRCDGFLAKLMERRRFGMRPGLGTILMILEALGNPHKGLRYIHVAGTNGKGATCAIIDAILRAADYKTCRYTSPHLVSVNERFFINGVPVDDAALDDAAQAVFPAIERIERDCKVEATFFESLTAIAFVLFARTKPDFVILETGLGGRLDATNAIEPEDVLASVITRIGLDHCEWLGNTYAEIAEEKAGIIKPRKPVVASPMPSSARDAIARAASLNASPFHCVEECVSCGGSEPLVLTTALRNLPPVKFALFGSFQIENAMTALATIDILQKNSAATVPDYAVVRGLETVTWPGRCQKIGRNGTLFIVDGAHNPCGAMALKEAVRWANLPQPIALVAGFCSDKDMLEHLRIMSGIAQHAYAVPIQNPRSSKPGD
ncbi:MAG: bifunctional folylpolyglutamate synthase/dihydrofolate synthase, partial [Kiritimatiellae bacterium]|nr:bifunctional folylpolyglutamate synthase/dihydrofolate synthase [Kiritimatiellia bacterium]